MKTTTSRATLIDVAGRAGVSLASTSRALHGGGASPEMVERVHAAARELGYSADAAGRSLRTKRTFQVAFAVADIGNPVYVEMMSAIHDVLAPHGYRVVVTSTGSTPQSTRQLVADLGGGFVDAMILVPLRIDDDLVAAVAAAAVPVIVIGPAGEWPGVDVIATDSAAGIGQAVAHLVATGRRRLGFVNGPRDTTPGLVCERGYDAAIADEAGVTSVGTVIADDFTVAAGTAAADDLLDRATADGRPLDAIVAANDLLAIGAIRAARARGLSVPDDLAVTGMDDTEFGRVFDPSLTSVSLGSTERGAAAARLALDRVLGGGSEPVHEHVGPRLIVRESTGHAEEVPA